MKFSVILADPPWPYDREMPKKNGGCSYPKMSIDEIMALPVQPICEKNCSLFMWTTGPKLNEAFRVIEAWGFRYCTIAFTWVKFNPVSEGYWSGGGHYTRSNVELCLLGMRGSIPVADRTVKQLVLAPRGRHSEKPDEVFARIERLFGARSRLEIFARKFTPGWYPVGDEIQQFPAGDILRALPLLSEADEGLKNWMRHGQP